MKSCGVMAARFHFSLFTRSSSICCESGVYRRQERCRGSSRRLPSAPCIRARERRDGACWRAGKWRTACHPKRRGWAPSRRPAGQRSRSALGTQALARARAARAAVARGRAPPTFWPRQGAHGVGVGAAAGPGWRGAGGGGRRGPARCSGGLHRCGRRPWGAGRVGGPRAPPHLPHPRAPGACVGRWAAGVPGYQQFVGPDGVVSVDAQLLGRQRDGLLHLRGHEHAGGPQQLQAALFHGLQRQEAVQVVHGQREDLLLALLLLADLPGHGGRDRRRRGPRAPQPGSRGGRPPPPRAPDAHPPRN